MSSLKQSVVAALENNDVELIRDMAKQNRGVLSVLVRFAYDKTTLNGWRAIRAIGAVARDYIKMDRGFLRDAVRKLLWSLSDESGGIGWSAPEILGEIVSADPDEFADIIPLIADVFSLEERTFRPGVLYALGRIVEQKPDVLQEYKIIIEQALQDEEPATKIYALQAMLAIGNCRIDRKTFAIIERLSNDKSVAWIYECDKFVEIEVGEMASKLMFNPDIAR
jgi:hypothetical protein